MTRLEKIARDLAAVLSPEGEADWRNFVGMAEAVGARMFRQFAEIVAPDSERADGGRFSHRDDWHSWQREAG